MRLGSSLPILPEGVCCAFSCCSCCCGSGAGAACWATATAAPPAVPPRRLRTNALIGKRWRGMVVSSRRRRAATHESRGEIRSAPNPCPAGSTSSSSRRLLIIMYKVVALSKRTRQQRAQGQTLLIDLFQLRPRLPLVPALLKLRLGLFQGRHAVRSARPRVLSVAVTARRAVYSNFELPSSTRPIRPPIAGGWWAIPPPTPSLLLPPFPLLRPPDRARVWLLLAQPVLVPAFCGTTAACRRSEPPIEAPDRRSP